MTLLADLLCSGRKPRLRGQRPHPPLAVPVCDPQCAKPLDPAFPWICKCCSSMRKVWRRLGETSGEGAALCRQPVCDPKMHLPNHWDPASAPWILQIPFPCRSLDAGRYGSGGNVREGVNAQPCRLASPEKYGGGRWLPLSFDNGRYGGVPTPVRTPQDALAAGPAFADRPRIFVPAWWWRRDLHGGGQHPFSMFQGLLTAGCPAVQHGIPACR